MVMNQGCDFQQAWRQAWVKPVRLYSSFAVALACTTCKNALLTPRWTSKFAMFCKMAVANPWPK